LSREEILELADAVAWHDGIATGIGTNRYGARLVVIADGRDEATERAIAEFEKAAELAGLPKWPIVRVELVSEAEAEDEDEDGDPDRDEDRDENENEIGYG